MKGKLPFLLQGLFVVFLWSAGKIVLKMGLEELPPYFFAGLVQLVVVGVLLVYTWLQRKNYSFQLSRRDKYLLTLSGVVGYGAATLFVMIGLQYVTGATAGLVAATSVIFNILIAGILIGEKPRWEQYAGVVILVVGVAIFLGNKVLGGTWLGVALLLLAEAAYAFNNAVIRVVNKAHHDNVSLPSVLIGNGVGALMLVPVGLVANGLPAVQWNLQLVVGLLLVAIIFAFGGLIWNNVLDKLRVVEVSILSNTMIIQVAILSVIFLHETLVWHNIMGGVLVIVGALVADRRLIFPKLPQWQLA